MVNRLRQIIFAGLVLAGFLTASHVSLAQSPTMSLSSFRLSGTTFHPGDTITLSANLKTGNTALTDAQMSMVIYNSKGQVFASAYSGAANYPANTITPVSVSYQLPSKSPNGNYRVGIQATSFTPYAYVRQDFAASFTINAAATIGGTCGSANSTVVGTAPVTNLCSTGTAQNFMTTATAYSWDCAGSNGASVACAATLLTNGACGTANGVTVVSAPVANLCASGTASSVSGSGPYTWSCAGTPVSGTTASCSAPKLVPQTYLASLTATVSTPTVNPGGTLLLQGMVQGAMGEATANITVTANIIDVDGSMIAAVTSSPVSVAANTVGTVPLTYTVPTNGVEFGTYSIQLYATDATNGYVSWFAQNASFIVAPASLVDLSTMTQTLDDEFTGGALNTAIWSPFFISLETFSNNNFLPDEYQMPPGGGLQLRADNRPFGGQTYAGGVVTSFGGFSQTYGYFEMKAQMPKGDGMWPAFWMVPIDLTWPPEIDILEWLGSKPQDAWTTLHWPGPNNTTPYLGGGCIGPDLSDGYHTYGLIWKPNLLIWTLDGVECFTITENVPSKPLYIMLNLALGGWEGGVDSSTTFPAYFNVAYVHAYQFPDSPAEVLPTYQTGKTFMSTTSGQSIAAGSVIQPGTTIDVTTTIIAGNAALTGAFAETQILGYQSGTSYAYASSGNSLSVPALGTYTYTIPITVPSNLPTGLYDIAIAMHADGETQWQGVAQQFYVGSPPAIVQ